MLCVLLGHALLVLLLVNLTRAPERARVEPVDTSFVSQPISLDMDIDDGPLFEQGRLISPLTQPPIAELSPPSLDADSLADGASGDSTNSMPGYTDWPKEGRDAAARVLAREAETERVAKLFAGPQGTWASLTKRQQSELNHFRWKPGVAGLERDEKGNTILHVSAGCTLVNFSMIACAIGKKPPPYGDLFKDMRLYFDEERRPATDEGNGREPESLRPPYWAKPLE